MLEWIHVLEEWLIEYGLISLIIVSFTESSFFPIPPDVLLLPMSIAEPDRAMFYALITTAMSVLGALLGWYIGKKFGRPILRYFVSEEKIEKVDVYFQKYGALAILIAGFTPIPYKIFTIFSGISNIKLRTLVIWSIIGRGLRFFSEAYIVITLGPKAIPFIEQNFTLITIIGGATILVLYIIYILLRKRKKQK